MGLFDKAKQAQQSVVTELQRLTQRKLQDLLCPRSERDVSRRRLLPLADDLLDLLAHGFEADAQALQSLGGHPLALVDEAQEDVLGADVVVVEHPGLFLSQDDNPPRAVRKPLEHLVAPHRAVGQRSACPTLSFRMLARPASAATR